jgi:hypothetical protein
LPMLAPRDPKVFLDWLWQVQAGITAIAFIGLALLLQFSTQFVIAGHTIRGALFRRTYFLPILAYRNRLPGFRHHGSLRLAPCVRPPGAVSSLIDSDLC